VSKGKTAGVQRHKSKKGIEKEKVRGILHREKRSGSTESLSKTWSSKISGGRRKDLGGARRRKANQGGRSEGDTRGSKRRPRNHRKQRRGPRAL